MRANWQALAIFLAALWWGAISALSFLAVPLLFAHLERPALAGPLAARLFTAQCWLGWALGLCLLWLLRCAWRACFDSRFAPINALNAARAKQLMRLMAWVILAMLLALVQEFGVAQRIVSARAMGADLRVWHTLGSAMVLGQWLCTAAVLWGLLRCGSDK